MKSTFAKEYSTLKKMDIDSEVLKRRNDTFEYSILPFSPGFSGQIKRMRLSSDHQIKVFRKLEIPTARSLLPSSVHVVLKYGLTYDLLFIQI